MSRDRIKGAVFAGRILIVVGIFAALFMATAALTMIKENLTSGFLWSAKPIGYPSGRGMFLRRVQAGAQRRPGGSSS
jgi:hypothetical protein